MCGHMPKTPASRRLSRADSQPEKSSRPMWWFERKCPSLGTTRRYGLVGIGVFLLEEVCHCGGRL